MLQSLSENLLDRRVSRLEISAGKGDTVCCALKEEGRPTATELGVNLGRKRESAHSRRLGRRGTLPLRRERDTR